MTVRHAIGITDWQSGRETATVQMSRGAESFVLVVNGGSPVLEHEREAAQSSLEAQLQLSTVPRAASDLRPERELSPLERAVRDRQQAIGLTCRRPPARARAQP